jgi:hypothetical protein
MSKLAFLIWIVAAPTLMGCLMVVTLVVPYFMEDQGTWIMVAVATGGVIAAPLSYFVAKAIKKITNET